ncbi:hypothetical protein JCGZ_13521 [Jatropha curcas]|uniref:Uncharacterized protein n=1 Tax=Jatropha curcas TaxID=180498 RepID=A0A067KLX6_JATCU|nr:hypothetical protein JCGZ_13521 [Jatropha curcas]
MASGPAGLFVVWENRLFDPQNLSIHTTPVSRPVQTPLAAQSPTGQASSDPRITLSLVAG